MIIWRFGTSIIRIWPSVRFQIPCSNYDFQWWNPELYFWRRNLTKDQIRIICLARFQGKMIDFITIWHYPNRRVEWGFSAIKCHSVKSIGTSRMSCECQKTAQLTWKSYSTLLNGGVICHTLLHVIHDYGWWHLMKRILTAEKPEFHWTNFFKIFNLLQRKPSVMTS